MQKKSLTKGIIHIAILIAFILVSLVAIALVSLKNSVESQPIMKSDAATPSPTPIAHYSQPIIKKADAYTIIFAGDSMIDFLGENFDYLRGYLKTYYPNTVFGLFNYGYGATNILSLPERFNTETTYKGKTHEAILARSLDIIIIGSFGHNPLSDLPLTEGLKKQSEVLDNVILQLVSKKPNTLIVFLADIAPSEKNYAKGIVDLSSEQRSIWVAERKAYIKNHIDYANSHNIPLINIYDKSQINGDVNPTLISKTDNIHPSDLGLIFMSKEIADFLYNNKILP